MNHMADAPAHGDHMGDGAPEFRRSASPPLLLVCLVRVVSVVFSVCFAFWSLWFLCFAERHERERLDRPDRQAGLSALYDKVIRR